MFRYEEKEEGLGPWHFTKRLLIATGLAGAFLWAMTPTADASSLKDIVNSTVRLYQNDRFACSATYVGSSEGQKTDYFLTAAHCVPSKLEQLERPDMVTLKWHEVDEDFRPVNTMSYNADTIRWAVNNDTALLETRSMVNTMMTPIDVITPAEFPTYDVDFGTPVMAVGYPRGLDVSVTMGTFTGRVKHPILDGEAYRSDAAIAGGSSGGGFYAKVGEDDYKLIGVSSAMYTGSQGINFFTTVDAIDEVLRYEVTNEDD